MRKKIYVLKKEAFDNTNCREELEKKFEHVFVVDAMTEFEELFEFDKVNSLLVIDNAETNPEIMNKVFRLAGRMKYSKVAIVCIEDKDYYFADKKHFYEVCDGTDLLGVVA